MERESITAILIGDGPSSEEAKSMSCPYCCIYTSSGNTVVGVFSSPPERRRWLELLEKKPSVAGLRCVEIFFSQNVEAQSPWSLGEVFPNKHIAPCGTECGSCQWYKKECEGCPSTKYYLGK